MEKVVKKKEQGKLMRALRIRDTRGGAVVVM